MTSWDVLDKVISSFPPIAAAALLVAEAVIFIVGFSRRGLNFIKYGFGKIALDETLEKRFDSFEKRFDSMEAKFDERFSQIDARLDGMDARIMAIETNHFGHLKDFLTELTSILLDKNIINNTEKARLDNQLRGM
ncbi:MAG: hypothetical protein LBH43_14260 [Treponema sp.]|jgi:hypothetical protein|nr:hypothetical protein [Treponema sp.]